MLARMPVTPLSPTALTLGRSMDYRRGDARRHEAIALHVVDVVEQRFEAARLAPQVLDDAEQLRAAAFHRDEDRACYQVAHVALRLVLGHLTDRDPAQVCLTRSPCPVCGRPDGRPMIDGEGPYFSLSHTRGWVMLAFADVPAGVDVEAVPSPKTVEETASALEARETAELALLPAVERPAAFARAWARKEACGKATGTGLAHNGLERYVGTGPLPASAGPGLRLYDVVAPAGHVAAVAVGTPRSP